MATLSTNNKFKIWIKSGKIRIDVEEICYCQADRCYSRVFLKSGKSHLISKPLKRLEEQLPQENFLRCHRSYLVNTLEIRSINIEGKKMYQQLYQIPFLSQRVVKLLSEWSTRIRNDQ